MAFGKRQPIGVELVKRGIVTENDVQTALIEQKKSPNKKIDEILKETVATIKKVEPDCTVLIK